MISLRKKKAFRKTQRDTKKKVRKLSSKNIVQLEEENNEEDLSAVIAALVNTEDPQLSMGDRKQEEALENLSNDDINVIYESRKEKLNDKTRTINASGVTINVLQKIYY